MRKDIDKTYIRCYVVKEKLDIKLFNTGVQVYDCSIPNKKALVLCVCATMSEKMAAEKAVEAVDNEHNIPIKIVYDSDPDIPKYLAGDYDV